MALAASPDNDLFVELIGGSDGPAKAAVEAALARGKPVVTANKALIAEHGAELAALAEANGAPLLFEAAVMGGTPAVKMLREAMVGDEVEAVAGILNGTCNYILTEMEATGRAFADVLAEAQRLGYAEADPTMDVGGFDAAHKITILAALAFGCAPTFAAAEVEGIDGVELIDIRLARDLGYRIKLVARRDAVARPVSPSACTRRWPRSAIRWPQAGGALNALFIEGRTHRADLHPGPGAGAGPTAAAVAADIADVMTGAARPVFQAAGRPSSSPFTPRRRRPTRSARAYLRLLVRDEPGVIAAVSETLAEAGVSIDSFLQKPVEDAGGVPIVLTTHAAPESVLIEAVRRIGALPAVLRAAPHVANRPHLKSARWPGRSLLA